jgi:hypothetical protein
MKLVYGVLSVENHWQASISIPSSAWSSRANNDIVARCEDAAIALLNESNKPARVADVRL